MSNQLLNEEELQLVGFLKSKIASMQEEVQRIIELAQVRKLQSFTALKDKVVCVIGGNGGLGSIFMQIFSATETTKFTFSLDLHNQEQAPELLPQADLVIFSVPIHQTPELIAHYSQWIKPQAGICDLTSIKTPALEAMLEHHSGPVLGMHPMFGIATPSLENQLIVTCPGRQHGFFAPYLELFQILGARIVETSASKHDQIMTHMQAVRHFNTYLQGAFTASEGYTLEELIQLSSPIYGLELIMIGRLFAQNPDLYADIIYDNPQSKHALLRYLGKVQEAVATLEAGDKEKFIADFEKTANFFGENAQEFLQQSALILEQAIELKKL
ncbi:bifunctional chorismate mutase/prephenate dehydrogenase [Psittacicella melopsittaci]|uniref:Bifunctional chorismate mutase/prephenate dehydrogenase n=1 Tax=Psittacicella melopsittaci TaxID=2028576 RepID=A0A3A1Y5Y6_9GAMM|nr:bifunctional chorismate mutase/prephenate dehydrogenase [Psittacicella melopsittaci]RIY31607.1 bifunctional chorismate mutase/prephenate dehydrogenase [Psittacicella melopsittaci]